MKTIMRRIADAIGWWFIGIGAMITPRSEDRGPLPGVVQIMTERFRQMSSNGEGFSAEHDDAHTKGQLIEAARAYAFAAFILAEFGGEAPKYPNDWPEEWDMSFWKPSADPIRNLVKAGALLAAEIDRLERKKSREPRAAVEGV